MKLEALRQCREFETTKLKELGEDGWTLQSIDNIHLPDLGVYEGDKFPIDLSSIPRTSRSGK